MGLFNIYLLTDKDPIKEITKEKIVRDSIYIVNDSIVEKIKYINKKYDEKKSTIMSADDSINLHIFSEYLNYYNKQ